MRERTVPLSVLWSALVVANADAGEPAGIGRKLLGGSVPHGSRKHDSVLQRIVERRVQVPGTLSAYLHEILPGVSPPPPVYIPVADNRTITFLYGAGGELQDKVRFLLESTWRSGGAYDFRPRGGIFESPSRSIKSDREFWQSSLARTQAPSGTRYGDARRLRG